ncbi:MAG: Sporulation Domain-Containing Protein [Bacteroidetes bacterium]|nr:Sporulation Domain-Containing Protein [Bacteroidota bacterium]
MKKILLLLSIFFIGVCKVDAQIEVIADGRLQTIIEQHITYNEIARTVPGYRIRVGVFTGAGSKQKAFDLRDELISNFPNVRSYVFFDEPNFTVKCGDYLTKLDAFSFFNKIKGAYSSATLIRDYINFPVISNDDLVLPEYYEEGDDSETE